MSRMYAWTILLVSGVLYFTVRCGFGYDTWQHASSVLLDSSYWGGAALAIHWCLNRTED